MSGDSDRPVLFKCYTINSQHNLHTNLIDKSFGKETSQFDSIEYFLIVVKYFWTCSNMPIYTAKYFWSSRWIRHEWTLMFGTILLNFSVQKLLLNCPSKETFEEMFENELDPNFEKIFQSNNSGAVYILGQ